MAWISILRQKKNHIPDTETLKRILSLLISLNYKQINPPTGILVGRNKKAVVPLIQAVAAFTDEAKRFGT